MAAEDGVNAARPFVLGLTGSIGMVRDPAPPRARTRTGRLTRLPQGKSTVAGFLRARGVPVVDADAIVAELYAPGGAAVAAVEARFPGSTGPEGGLDRARLSRHVVGRPAALAALEALVHPLVAAERRRREAALAREGGHAVVAVDIPLLYETGAEATCDAVLVVAAPPAEQARRVLARPGMTPEKFAGITARQLPSEEKCRRADHVVDTGCSLAATEARVAEVVAAVRAQAQAGAEEGAGQLGRPGSSGG